MKRSKSKNIKISNIGTIIILNCISRCLIFIHFYVHTQYYVRSYEKKLLLLIQTIFNLH